MTYVIGTQQIDSRFKEFMQDMTLKNISDTVNGTNSNSSTVSNLEEASTLEKNHPNAVKLTKWKGKYYYALQTTTRSNKHKNDEKSNIDCNSQDKVLFWVVPLISGGTFGLIVVGCTILFNMLNGQPPKSDSD